MFYPLVSVILSIAQSVFEVGASIKDVNLHALKLHHQINKNIEEKKIDPLKVANELFKTGFNEIKAKRNEDAQKTFITISDKASEALANLEDKKLDIDTFKLCVHALKLSMFSKIAMYCFNLQSKTFLPYSNYPKYFQEQIAEELENLSIKSLMLKKNVEVKPSIFTRSKVKEANKEESQNILNDFLQACYPYLSNGFGWTKSGTKISSSQTTKVKIQVKTDFLPKGEGKKTCVHVGVIEETQKIVAVYIWVSEQTIRKTKVYKLHIENEGSSCFKTSHTVLKHKK